MSSNVHQALAKSVPKDVPTNIRYKGTHVPSPYALIADLVENFGVRDDDIWVSGYPRTGTTWTQEMVWLIANNIDFKGATVPLIDRFPLLEASGSTPSTAAMNGKSDNQLNSVKYVANLPSPRFIKTHLPFHLLPRQLRERTKKAKIVYVTRNPKDACISNYYYAKFLRNECVSFEDFCRLFLEGEYVPLWDHVNSYWERKDDKNILCLKYEDMKENLPSIIRKTAAFLDKKLNDTQIQDLNHHLSFSSMKKNSAINRELYLKKLRETSARDEREINQVAFIREGNVAQGNSKMSSELIKEFDDWTAENLKKFPSLCDEFP